MKVVKTIRFIDLLNEIVNGNYEKIKQMKMYYQNRRIYYDKTLGCNLSSIKFSDTNKKVTHSNMNLLEDIQIKEEILDEKEKEYLSNVIRPFRDRIKSIVKSRGVYSECIYIKLNNYDAIVFPNFQHNTMYKNMEPNKDYMLKDLGL